MTNFTSKAEILMKGCGTNKYEGYYKCRSGSLCPECEARISQMREDLQAYKELSDKLHKDFQVLYVTFGYNTVSHENSPIYKMLEDICQALKVLDGEKT